MTPRGTTISGTGGRAGSRKAGVCDIARKIGTAGARGYCPANAATHALRPLVAGRGRGRGPDPGGVCRPGGGDRSAALGLAGDGGGRGGASAARWRGAVAEVGRTLAGSVLWEEQDGGLYVSRLAVAPAWRRRGIAPGVDGRRRKRRRGRCGCRACIWHAAGAGWTTGGCSLRAASSRRRETHPGYAEPTFVNMEKPLNPTETY